MSTAPFVLPQAVGQLLGKLPAYPGSLLLVTALNLALTPQLTPDVTALLLGKKLRLRVTDAQSSFDFEWRHNRFLACHNPGAADLTLSASAHDFMLLARRQEDPDTLFFSRRLAMEGDTELGLLFKNTLDAIDLPPLTLASFSPAQMLARWRGHGARHS